MRADLVASEYGWVWVLYYSERPRQSATHYTFIHADGYPLVSSIATSLKQQAIRQELEFSKLKYLEAASDMALDKQAAQGAYFKYLENELGEIQFEGMPTDKEAGAVKVNLENIYVPLQFTGKRPGNDDDDFSEQMTINEVVSRTTKAAILAKPGGGKSTLIRRIALAYAYTERRLKVEDGLPDRNWFPIYIRCRDIGDDATKSILEVIGTIVQRAEIARYKQPFDALVEDALQDGRVLLLIDGLDEISNEKHRIKFANQLRTFIATYPSIHLIITSREAGFRSVSGTIGGYCDKYFIAGLQVEEIRHLCLKWHQQFLENQNKQKKKRLRCVKSSWMTQESEHWRKVRYY